MRHSGAIVEGRASAVAPASGGRSRYSRFRQGIHRSGASSRTCTRWRPQPRADETIDRSVPMFLAFAAVVVWVMCGFRMGYPNRVATGSLFAALASGISVVAVIAAASITAALTAGGFGDLRRAAIKFSGIILASLGAWALFGGLAGLVANEVTFAVLVFYLFDVEWLDVALLGFFHLALSALMWLAAVAVFVA